MPVTSRGVSTPRAIRLDEAVEAVLEADAFDAGVVPRLDDGANDGVEAGRVAAAGEDAEARECGHVAMECNRDARVAAAETARGTIAVRVSGRLAQLGERRVRNAEVGSSSLVPSTILRSPSASFGWQAKRVARSRRMSTEAAQQRRWTAPAAFFLLAFSA